MKALTIWEPWASLIAAGRKSIETRGWHPPRDLIGQRIAIHAGMNRGPIVREAIEEFFPGYRVDRPMPRVKDALHATDEATGRILTFRLGHILATAWLADVAQVVAPYRANAAGQYRCLARSMRGEYVECRPDKYGYFGERRWLFFLEDVRRLAEPRCATGGQGFWECRLEEAE